MENQIPEIKSLYEKFIKSEKYQLDKEKSEWEGLSIEFKNFWENKILNGSKDDLDNKEIDKIVGILDSKGKGNNPNSPSVANTMIRQSTWREMFQGIKSNDDLKLLLDSIFKEQNEIRLIKLIDDLYEKNKNIKIESLTNKNGVAINDFLFIYDPNHYISVVSLEKRKKIIESFGFKNGPDFDKDSFGEKIVASNKAILEGFKEILGDLEFTPRSISDFLYSEPIKSKWDQNTENKQHGKKKFF